MNDLDLTPPDISTILIALHFTAIAARRVAEGQDAAVRARCLAHRIEEAIAAERRRKQEGLSP